MEVPKIILLCFVFTQISVDALSKTAVNSFFVLPDQEEITVSVGILKDDECKFTFSTQQKNEKDEEVPKKTYPSQEQLISEFTQQAPCIDGSKDGWNFKVCVGQSVVQSLPGSDNLNQHSLGKYTETEKLEQKYEKGDPTDCKENTPRHAIVKFACSNGGQSVYSIHEPEMCFYVIGVASSHFCENPDFPVISESYSQSNSGEIPWMLEITRYDDDSIQCVARHTGLGNMDSRVFSEATLVMNNNTSVKAVARRANRKPIDADEIEHINGGVTLRNKDPQFISLKTVK